MKNFIEFVLAIFAAVMVLVWLLFDGEARREYEREYNADNEIY
jgi:hypothetical protein